MLYFINTGILLPYSDEKVDVTKALHHHGDEPERPGYTLQEIVQLSRSSNLQQRVVALKTLSNILDKVRICGRCSVIGIIFFLFKLFLCFSLLIDESFCEFQISWIYIVLVSFLCAYLFGAFISFHGIIPLLSTFHFVNLIFNEKWYKDIRNKLSWLHNHSF